MKLLFRLVWLVIGLIEVFNGRQETALGCFIMSELFNVQQQIEELKNGTQPTESTETRE